MTDTGTRQKAIALYDRFTHGGMGRRDFMTRMVALTGSLAAAEALVAGIAASPARAAVVPADDERLTTGTMTFEDPGGYSAYVAEPRKAKSKATILVIHENRGLNDHIRDVARRLALAGYRAVAPDFLSPVGGTPADEDAARSAIGALDLTRATAAGSTMVGVLSQSSPGGKVGAIGFCWGGAYVNRLAVAAGQALDAGVVFYGPAPDVEEANAVEAPLQIHLASLDDRVNRTGFPWVTALRDAGKTVRFYLYEGVNHAFHNDTSADRYDKASAQAAWHRSLRFFDAHLR